MWEMRVYCALSETKTAKELDEQLASLDVESLSDKKTRAALAKDLLKGEERTLRGYLLRSEPEFARSMVIDLDVKSDRPALSKDMGSTPLFVGGSSSARSASATKKMKLSSSSDAAASPSSSSSSSSSSSFPPASSSSSPDREPEKRSYDGRIRLIDHRTLAELIFKNARYLSRRSKSLR